MRKAFALLTVAPALFAFPALAQLAPDGTANVNLVGKVGLNGGAVGAAVDGVTSPVGHGPGRGRAVESVAESAAARLDSPHANKRYTS